MLIAALLLGTLGAIGSTVSAALLGYTWIGIALAYPIGGLATTVAVLSISAMRPNRRQPPGRKTVIAARAPSAPCGPDFASATEQAVGA